MPKFQLLILSGLIQLIAGAQILPTDFSIYPSDTLKTFCMHKKASIFYAAPINHQEKSLGNKMLKGTLFASAYNITMGTYLLIAPERISKWDKKEKLQIRSIKNQYQKSFTAPPVVDYDLWYINYIGHPYQGGFYYNTLRNQDVNVWYSAMFCIGQSILWEYGWEAGMEQPSIQDLISTPIAGILVGELSHVATIKMSRNGFRWYEVALVCLINPSYAFNKGFKSKHPLKP